MFLSIVLVNTCDVDDCMKTVVVHSGGRQADIEGFFIVMSKLQGNNNYHVVI